MTIWAVIPAKPLAEGKSRLAPVLSTAQRARLNEHLFHHTLATTLQLFAPENVIIISRDANLRSLACSAGAIALAEQGNELNAALRQAAKMLPPGDGLLSISTDLPCLTAADLHAMLAQRPAVGIAPDLAGTGTNALLTHPAACIPYCFGENSFARHGAAAVQRRLAIRIIERPGLAFDLDTPEDLPACPAGFQALWKP